MRLFFVIALAAIGLSGCMTNQQLGAPGSCNQVGSTVSAPVMCPAG